MNILKSIGAILAGLTFIFVTHSLADFLLESAGIFPPQSEGLHETWMLALALAYRIVLSIAGCFVTAKLAPHGPMKHALILGFIGVFLSTVGAVVGIRLGLSDAWYPIALVLVTLPCAWLGGWLAARNAKMA